MELRNQILLYSDAEQLEFPCVLFSPLSICQCLARARLTSHLHAAVLWPLCLLSQPPLSWAEQELGVRHSESTASCGFCVEARVPSSLRSVSEVEMRGDGCLGGKSTLPVHLLGSFRRNLRIA